MSEIQKKKWMDAEDSVMHVMVESVDVIMDILVVKMRVLDGPAKGYCIKEHIQMS